MSDVRFVVEEEDKTPKVRFVFVQENSGVNVMAEEENGEVWYVLRLTPGEPVMLYRSVPQSVGLPLNSQGAVLTEIENC